MLGATSEWMAVNKIAAVLRADYNGTKKAVSILRADGRIVAHDLPGAHTVYANPSMRDRLPEPPNRSAEIDGLIVGILQSRSGWTDARAMRELLPADLGITGEYFRSRLYSLMDSGIIAAQEPIGGITYRRYAMPGTPAPAAPKDKAEKVVQPMPIATPKRTTPWTVIQGVLDVHTKGGTVTEVDALLASNLATQHQEAAATRDQLALLASWKKHGGAVLRAARSGRMGE